MPATLPPLGILLIAMALCGVSGCAVTSGAGAVSALGSSCTNGESGLGMRICDGNKTLRCSAASTTASDSSGSTQGAGGGYAPGPPTSWQVDQDCAAAGQICINGGCFAAVGTGKLQGHAVGLWQASCGGVGSSGSFACDIDSSGQAAGSFSGGGSGSLSGSVGSTGTVSLTAAGSQGSCPWQGNLAVWGGNLTGSGSFSCTTGCTGTWETAVKAK